MIDLIKILLIKIVGLILQIRISRLGIKINK